MISPKMSLIKQPQMAPPAVSSSKSPVKSKVPPPKIEEKSKTEKPNLF